MQNLQLRRSFKSLLGVVGLEERPASRAFDGLDAPRIDGLRHYLAARPWRRVIHRAVWRGVFILFDCAVVTCAYGLGLLLRFGARVPETYALRFPAVAVALCAMYVTANVLLQLYRRGWRFAGAHDARALGQSVAVATGLAVLADTVTFPANHPLPVSVVPAAGVFTLVGMGLGRFRHRLHQQFTASLSRSPAHRVLIIGGGTAGEWVARELQLNPALGYRPVCFADDDPDKQGQHIHGLRVSGTRHQIRSLVRRHRVDTVVLAIPSLAPEERRAMLAICEETPARIKIVPGLPELLDGRHDDVLFRDAQLEDLLGRSPVVFGEHSSVGRVSDGTVLITGAAGSIGSELARQLAAAATRRLVLLDTNESGLFDVAAELERSRLDKRIQLEIVVADVRHAAWLNETFRRYQPTTVFHVAAYKHVPLMEAHPHEAVLTNVLGTYNVCRAAVDAGCERVVFISTDKAVAPASVMGATKRVGELIVRAFASSDTIFCAVRFGNVLGSRGSVVPTFARQIREGGPLTITHPDVTRFFMTIPEAAQLITMAACQAVGGEIFILDMGTPVRVMDLARKLIRLHGLRPEADIPIREIGLRPGEKLHEVLTSSTEAVRPTEHPRVLQVQSTDDRLLRPDEVFRVVERLGVLAETAPADVLVDALFAAAGGNRRAACRETVRAWRTASSGLQRIDRADASVEGTV